MRSLDMTTWTTRQAKLRQQELMTELARVELDLYLVRRQLEQRRAKVELNTTS